MLGAYLSDSTNGPMIGYRMNVTPQIVNDRSKYLLNTVEWTLISGIYKAKGDEQFLTIGNFFNDSSSEFRNRPGVHPFNLSYYFVDDVSVEECDSLSGNCLQPRIVSGTSIYPNPSPGLVTVSKEDSSNMVLEIYNVIGQIIFKTEIEKSQTTIDLGSLSEGIYFLRLVGVRKEKITFKLILQNNQ